MLQHFIHSLDTERSSVGPIPRHIPRMLHTLNPIHGCNASRPISLCSNSIFAQRTHRKLSVAFKTSSAIRRAGYSACSNPCMDLVTWIVNELSIVGKPTTSALEVFSAAKAN